MELSTIITGVLALLSSGGCLYLIIEKEYSRKQDTANTQTTVISNSNEIADLYKKIDEIVESKTAPIREELKEIKANWCCYRESCEMRILSPFNKKD